MRVALAGCPAAVAVLAIATGCAGSSVARHADVELRPGQGAVVLVVDTDTPLESIVFSPGDPEASFTIHFAERGVSAHVFVVAAGRYALEDFRLPHAALDPASGGRLCLEVEAGKVSYPGHFFFRATDVGQDDGDFAKWGWRSNMEDVQARLRTGWPELIAGYPLSPRTCR